MRLIAALEPSARRSCRQRHEHSSINEPRSACRRVPPHPAPGGSCCFAAPLLCVARRHIRRPRIIAGFARHLRGHLVFSYSADSGTRYPHGSRRDPGTCPIARNREDPETRAHRHCCRRRGIVRHCGADFLSPLWNRPNRSANLRLYDPGSGRGRIDRRLSSSTSRLDPIVALRCN